MKKSIYILTVLSLASCTVIKSGFSSYDPYENVVIKRKIEKKVEKKEILEKVTPKKIEKEDVITKVIETKEEELKPVVIDTQSEVILKRFKQDYGLIESNETIKRLTREYITKIQEKTHKKVRVAEFLLQVNKVIKETKTKSYTLAITRVLNNWSK